MLKVVTGRWSYGQLWAKEKRRVQQQPEEEGSVSGDSER